MTRWPRPGRPCPRVRQGELVVFHPLDGAGVARVGAAVAEATRIRADLDTRLGPVAAAVTRARGGLRRVADSAGPDRRRPHGRHAPPGGARHARSGDHRGRPGGGRGHRGGRRGPGERRPGHRRAIGHRGRRRGAGARGSRPRGAHRGRGRHGAGGPGRRRSG